MTELNNIIFGRLEQPDERNRNFAFIPGRQRSYTWGMAESIVLNQGAKGCCVGCAFAHELACYPVGVKGVTLQKAIEKIYWEAQKIDNFAGGDYPGATPRMEGTSILAGVKVLQTAGYYTAYKWVFNATDLALGVGSSGTAVIGVNWYTGMMQPNANYQIKPTGALLGGHAVCVRGVSFKRKELLIQNSWGSSWGANGCAFISFADMDTLLKSGGDAVFPVRNPKMLSI